VYLDGIATSNVKQGSLGDCYFIATLGAAAKDPSRIKDRFYSNEPNTAGIYVLKLFVNGIINYVILDDYLPV
jgi:calpain-15